MRQDLIKGKSNGDDNIIYVTSGSNENTLTLISYRTINIIKK